MGDILNTGIQTTNKALYFLCVDTRERLEIQFVPPSLRITDDADIAVIKIIGRSTPKYQNSGGEVTMPLELDFYSDEENRTSVVRKCNWLRSLRYSDGKKPAKRVALIFGNMFKKEIWTVRNVSVEYTNFSKKHGYMANQAKVTINLCLDVDYNLKPDDINVTYPIGPPDGSSIFQSNPERPNDDTNDAWLNVTDGNSFAAIRTRALQRLGLADGRYI